MDAKKYLNEIREYERRKKALLKSLEHTHIRNAGIRGISYDTPRVQGSHTNRLEQQAIIMCEEIEELQEDIAEITENIDAHLQKIKKMPDAQYKRLLYLKYVRGMDFESISKEMGRRVSYLKKVHTRAIKQFSELYHDELESIVE